MPGAVATMVVEPTAAPVRLKVAVVVPAPMVTLAGCNVTIPAGLAESATTVPPAGADLPRVTVPFIVRVSPRFVPSKVTAKTAIPRSP